MPDNRKGFLDILRIAATCMVVLMHTVTGAVNIMDVNAYPTHRTALLLIMDLVTWCVPVFLMISGYLFLDPLREADFRTMLGKYCRRVLLALFLFGVPFACLEWIAVNRTVRAEMVWEAFLMVLRGQGWTHMWYLYLIFFLYLFTPLLKKLLSFLPRSGLYAGMGVLFIGCSGLPFLNKVLGREELPILPEEAIYLFYYLCGYFMVTGRTAYAMRMEERHSTEAEKDGMEWRKAFHGRKVLQGGGSGFLVLLVLLTGVLAGMIYSRSFGNWGLQMAYNYPPTVLLSVLIMWIAMEIEERYSRGPVWKRLVGRRLEGTAALAFTIYLIHPLFLNVFYKFLGFSPLNYPLYLSLPFFFVATLALSVLGAWMLRKIPVLRKYVL